MNDLHSAPVKLLLLALMLAVPNLTALGQRPRGSTQPTTQPSNEQPRPRGGTQPTPPTRGGTNPQNPNPTPPSRGGTNPQNPSPTPQYQPRPRGQAGPTPSGPPNPQYRPHAQNPYYRPNYRPTSPTLSYYNTWHSPDRVWIPGHWVVGYRQQRIWVPGHWRVRSGYTYIVVYEAAPPTPMAYSPSLGPSQFADAMAYLYSAPTESRRMRIANQLLRNHVFTASQVRDMLLAFTFESSRLSLAKQAYLRTLDPENYATVYEALQFESSAIELDAYIQALWPPQ